MKERMTREDATLNPEYAAAMLDGSSDASEEQIKTAKLPVESSDAVKAMEGFIRSLQEKKKTD